MKLIQLVEIDQGQFHAGGKAPRDVAKIASRLGFADFMVVRTLTKKRFLNPFYQVLWILKSWWYVLKMPRHAVVLVQFPCQLFRGRLGFDLIDNFRKVKDVRIITVVHDLDVIRGMVASEAGEQVDYRYKRMVAFSDVLIVHNSAMREWMAEHGAESEKMIVLGIFDYLTDAPVARLRDEGLRNLVMVAGNLDCRKTGYLASLSSVVNVQWRLWGPNYQQDRLSGQNITYGGSHAPEKLPEHLDGGFGLVWDGDSVETCAGEFGIYLKYNNPHKLSLYLASGIPVVIWREAAEAELVRKEKVGVIVDSLLDMGDALASVSDKEYRVMRNNAVAFGQKLRDGFFMKRAILSGLEKLGRR